MKKTTSAGFFCLISILNFLTGCGQNNFTGVFAADSRPHQIFLMTLIQTKDTVSGSLIIAKPDGNGGMDSDTLPLRGTTDGDAITLTADRLFGDRIINGRKEGRNIVLMCQVPRDYISLKGSDQALFRARFSTLRGGKYVLEPAVVFGHCRA